MLTIRLTRKGKKNQPFFRVVVVDKRRSAKGGRAVEVLGYSNPLTKKISLEKERILYWLGVGAKASGTVHNLLVNEKIIDEKKVNVVKIKKSVLPQGSSDAKDNKAQPASAAPVTTAPETSVSSEKTIEKIEKPAA